MATAPPERYQRRRAAGEQSRQRTRALLVAAADALFRERGYASTTVSAIAARAGVSLQTLYLAWGSKHEVFRAAAAAAAGGGGEQAWTAAVAAELAAALQAGGGSPNAAAHLRAVARVFVAVTERTTVYRQLYREAVVADPALGQDWAEVQAGAASAIRAVADDLPRSQLRPELDAERVFLTLWALLSPEVFDAMTQRAGKTPTEVEAWLGATLTAALTSPA